MYSRAYALLVPCESSWFISEMKLMTSVLLVQRWVSDRRWPTEPNHNVWIHKSRLVRSTFASIWPRLLEKKGCSFHIGIELRKKVMSMDYSIGSESRHTISRIFDVDPNLPRYPRLDTYWLNEPEERDELELKLLSCFSIWHQILFVCAGRRDWL